LQRSIGPVLYRTVIRPVTVVAAVVLAARVRSLLINSIATDLIGEVGRHNFGIGLVVTDTQANVAFAIEHDEGCRVRDQHVDTQVKLLSVEQ